MSADVRVAVVGAGALGCALLPRLARMRIQELRVIDGDRVEQANLERQSLYTEADIGQAKASTTRYRLATIEHEVDVIAHDRFLDAANARDLIPGVHLVADCTDDLHAKELLDRVCAHLGIPLVSGAVHEQQGQMIVLHAPGVNAHLRRSDLFSGRVGGEQDGCDMQRVPSDVIEAVGQRMADSIQEFLHGGSLANGSIGLYDRTVWTSIEAPR
jgi:molybdopterin-synthase adenylyltransferase